MSTPLLNTLKSMIYEMRNASGLNVDAIRVLLNDAGAADLCTEIESLDPKRSKEQTLEEIKAETATLFGARVCYEKGVKVRVLAKRTDSMGASEIWYSTALYGWNAEHPVAYSKPARA